MNDVPKYEGALKHESRRKIIRVMAELGGIANFSQIAKATGIPDSTLNHHLGMLLHYYKIIEMEVKGTYRLRYRTPLCFALEKAAKYPVAYFGLLGKRKTGEAGYRKEPETDIALRLLDEEGITPKLVYVTTSNEAWKQWEELKLPYQFIICYEDEIIDIEAVKVKVTPQLESLLRDFVVVIDCTGATKPATIAYYELAQTYMAPLIYVYETKKQLKWLISKKTIREKLGLESKTRYTLRQR